MHVSSCFRRAVPLVLAVVLATPAVLHAQGIEQPRIPLRTALNEISALRASYQEAFNRNDVKALMGMFEPDAVMIGGDGVVLNTHSEISKSLERMAGNGAKETISSDLVRVWGHTAYDMGTVSETGSDGKTQVSHYLVVLRRGLKEWNISSLAVVPVMSGSMSH